MEISVFTKDDTNRLKGIAILFMLLHHFTGVDASVALNYSEFTVMNFLGNIGKVCVALLTILSGYGVCCSFQKEIPDTIRLKITFILVRLAKLYSVFWVTILFRFFFQVVKGGNLQDIYGSWDKEGIWNLSVELLGLTQVFHTPSIHGPWWYMTVAVFNYLFFLFAYYVIRKAGIVIPLLCWTPWLLKEVPALSGINWGNTDSWIFYFYAFCIGIYLAQKNIPGRIKRLSRRYQLLCAVGSGILFLSAGAGRSVLGLWLDPVLAMAIVLYGCCAPNLGIITGIIRVFGQYSYIIYLIHIYILQNIAYDVMNFHFINTWMVFIMFILECLAYAMVIEQTRKIISNELRNERRSFRENRFSKANKTINE